MAALFEGVFTSKLHTFVVGDEKVEITVHAEVIAKLSTVFEVLLNGDMAEARTGKTILEDVSKDMFIRFCQFAYTGNYTTPAFTQVPITASADELATKSMTESPPEAPYNLLATPEQPEEIAADLDPAEEVFEAPVEDGFGGWGYKDKKDKKSKKAKPKTLLLRQSLDNLKYDTATSRSVRENLCQVRDNKSTEEDYTHVFLGHARLYVFADKWHINELKVLTLFKLHKTLINFTLYEARRIDIIELVKFAYSNDNTADRDDGIDDLRALITHYITCELRSLIKAPELLEFLQEPGQFSRDLVRMMMKRFE